MNTVSSTSTAAAQSPFWVAFENIDTAVPLSKDANAVDGVVVDSETAAHMKEAETSLLRTLQEAHAALHSSQTITTALATQGETLTYLEECVAENHEEWRQGRREMRRTRHWHTALAHWLRCGKGGSRSQVANKSPGAPPAARRLSGTAPVTDFSTCRRLKRESRTRSETSGGITATQPEAAHFFNADALGDCSAPAKKGNNVQRAAVAEDMSTDVMKSPESTTPPVHCGSRHRAAADKHRVSRCVDVAMCDRMEPTLDEIRGIVGELHDRATMWNAMLTSDVGRMDELIKRTDKTRAKNKKVNLR
ncbi:hypothetical protein conserved [Leishmania donovani]|uniref:Hypothetical_protein_conserved n=1 Tax=Leishmania donovani TaxID=5661 RepID=A0A3S5H6Z1_LEIDO|nr:hypothetical protein, unknown function [Leishmania donovani]AYU77732.1 hypothetical protein LdCL_160020500 [Leishmania donovani]TPP51101.1 hypothetical protein CGC21_24665 [Leishmania donovani]CAJ1987742.1 hypothetical protein conserved [Leishmania donovani]CBZ33132.1 hypothetical protein, unknown function [Leishmania donovani]VDZ43629.1 hypothetical_protein_conserved [Leishmania donovani]